MDPIADYLTHLRNAMKARHPKLSIKSSRIKQAITRVLKEKGYIEDYRFEEVPPQGMIHIRLRYNEKTHQPAVECLRRVSKPSLRKYTKAADLPHVLNGLGIAILSTSRGIMTDKEARKQGIGGEELCHIY